MINEKNCPLITLDQINNLEKFADRLLDKFGIDVEFSKHFGDRMSDSRNDPCIQVAELQQLFKKIGRDKAKRLKNVEDDEAVLVDLQKDLNLPFVISPKPDGELEITMKTIMRKPDFKTRNKKVRYESIPIAEQILRSSDYEKFCKSRGSMRLNESEDENIQKLVKSWVKWRGGLEELLYNYKNERNYEYSTPSKFVRSFLSENPEFMNPRDMQDAEWFFKNNILREFTNNLRQKTALYLVHLVQSSFDEQVEKEIKKLKKRLPNEEQLSEIILNSYERESNESRKDLYLDDDSLYDLLWGGDIKGFAPQNLITSDYLLDFDSAEVSTVIESVIKNAVRLFHNKLK